MTVINAYKHFLFVCVCVRTHVHACVLACVHVLVGACAGVIVSTFAEIISSRHQHHIVHIVVLSRLVSYYKCGCLSRTFQIVQVSILDEICF
jgi:hypothetical protein